MAASLLMSHKFSLQKDSFVPYQLLVDSETMYPIRAMIARTGVTIFRFPVRLTLGTPTKSCHEFNVSRDKPDFGFTLRF